MTYNKTKPIMQVNNPILTYQRRTTLKRHYTPKPPKNLNVPKIKYTFETLPTQVQQIIDLAIEGTDITREQILGDRRHRPIVTARHIAIYVILNKVYNAYPQGVATWFNRNHATIFHAVEQIGNFMEYEKIIQEKVKSIIDKI